MTESISWAASASDPWNPASISAARGTKRVPVAAAIAAASAISDAAAGKSPRQVSVWAIEFRWITSKASKPAARQACSCRAWIANDRSSSHKITAATPASQP